MGRHHAEQKVEKIVTLAKAETLGDFGEREKALGLVENLLSSLPHPLPLTFARFSI